ncbi:MAG: hypothetical protein FWB93_00915 [Oscillospiraceae bacterium]|nr:hypothetical protein [Oscillospiraceae bacterium]
MNYTALKIDDTEKDLLMDTMFGTPRPKEGAKVGMFWYNSRRNVLVGVFDEFAANLPFNQHGRKTIGKLHHIEWQNVRADAIAMGSTDEIFSEEDYTLVPRGRVFQIRTPDDKEYYQIMVGSWFDKHPEAGQLVINRFNLQNADFDFVESEHWDIGKGTSELFV